MGDRRPIVNREPDKTIKHKGDQEHGEHLHKLLTSTAFDGLRDALITRDPEIVRKALEKCRASYGFTEKQAALIDEVDATILRAFELKEEMMMKCRHLPRMDTHTTVPKSKIEKEEMEQIKSEIQILRDRIEEDEDLRYILRVERFQADKLLELLDRQEELQAKHRHQFHALELNNKALSEIRRYPNPPALLHRIVKGALLLLGEDEEKTEDWKYCQLLCNPHAKQQTLKLRLQIFDRQPETMEQLNPEIVARAKEILFGTPSLTKDSSADTPPQEQDFGKRHELDNSYYSPRRQRSRKTKMDRKMYPEMKLKDAETIGAGTGLAFYVWASDIIERAGGGDGATPANIMRQKQIFAEQREKEMLNKIKLDRSPDNDYMEFDARNGKAGQPPQKNKEQENVKAKKNNDQPPPPPQPTKRR